MSKFIGVKMVEAVPMTASEALQKDYRVGQNGTIIAPTTRGYEVTYHDGYKSWSPADVFEASYFGLDEDNDGTKILLEDVNNFIDNVDVSKIGNKTTLVHARTLTGFEMINHSSCVDPANYNELLGKEYAMEEITNKVWSHLGFVLQWAKNGLNKTNNDINIPPHVLRMMKEQEELGDKITKLQMFISNSPIFNTLSETKKTLMTKQLTHMSDYFHVLEERIKEESVNK